MASFSDVGELHEGFPAFHQSSIHLPATNAPANRRGRASTVILVGGSIATENSATSSSQLPNSTNSTSAPQSRGRARSTTLVGATSPLECPVTAEEQQLANLAHKIKRANERAASLASVSDTIPTEPPARALSANPTLCADSNSLPAQSSQASSCLVETGEKRASTSTLPDTCTPEFTTPAPTAVPSPGNKYRNPSCENIQDNCPPPRLSSVSTFEALQPQPSPRVWSTPTHNSQLPRVQLPVPESELLYRIQQTSSAMNSYPNYLDSSGSVPNARQAPPSPSPHQNGMSGGGMGMTGGMVGFPTPAGHQSDLNYIMQMVEELAGQLAHNQGLTAGIVDKMGKVRAKAKNQELSNDELLAMAAAELNVSSENIEKENSELRKALEKTLFEKKENWKLALHGANILADVLDKMHKFRATHEADTLAWHKNYRKQLADEREENQNLRNQINDMKAAAARANENLRQMRRHLTDHDELKELRVQNYQYRLERRSWKRMALPMLHASDSEFSDDDDIVDPEEKKRLAAEKAEKERKDKEGEGDIQGPGN